MRPRNPQCPLSQSSPHPKVSSSAADGLTWDALSDPQWSFTFSICSHPEAPSELNWVTVYDSAVSQSQDFDLSPQSVAPGPRPRAPAPALQT